MLDEHARQLQASGSSTEELSRPLLVLRLARRMVESRGLRLAVAAEVADVPALLAEAVRGTALER